MHRTLCFCTEVAVFFHSEEYYTVLCVATESIIYILFYFLHPVYTYRIPIPVDTNEEHLANPLYLLR